jgi:peptidoglycan biosynthesis protein MviN/MurJ (putative lipid II flippase)
MDLPSFIWLWKIAAWSMGLSLAAYVILAVTGFWMYRRRSQGQTSSISPVFIEGMHYFMGICMATLVLLLLAIGIIGTLGHFGSLGHSSHLFAGFVVVGLVFVSAIAALQIKADVPGARRLHLTTNIILFIAFCWVSLTGWFVVQKYLP